jgi:succinyl-CoA synthetase beta subunit
MKLREYEGKALFVKYGIPVPQSQLVSGVLTEPPFHPSVLKAQTLSGDRQAAGGIVMIGPSAAEKRAFPSRLKSLLGKTVGGEEVKEVLIEELVAHEAEYYVSISYDTDSRSPVLSLSAKGGSGIAKAKIFPIDLTVGMPSFFVRHALGAAAFPKKDWNALIGIIIKLWKLFIEEYALLAEINPLFSRADGTLIAGDAKIILDDEKLKPTERRFIEMDGDIAILASGGGASLLNIDTLLAAGGRPANYTEYSGNPPAEVVNALTKRVLGRKGLKGCWVIGGTANFTDIFETLKGFVEGLDHVTPKPTYPIVIRRDGPRAKEAFEMLAQVGKEKGYDFHCYDSHTSMSETARIITKLAKKS